jgi:hypothetical protein
MDIILSILVIAGYVLFIVIAPVVICLFLLVMLGWQLSRTSNPRRRSLLLLGIIVVVAILAYVIWLDSHASV